MSYLFTGLQNSLYWYPAMLAFVFSGTVTLSLVISRLILLRSNLHDSRLEKVIFRLGGIAIIAGFMGAIFMDPNLVISWKLWGVISAIGVVIIAGVWDDIATLDWKTQLFAHCILGLIVIAFGIEIEVIANPFGGIFNISKWGGMIAQIILVMWIVFFVNAMNWMDGVDGLSGSVTLIGALTVFGISLRPEVNQPPMGIMAMALAGATAGFLILNAYPARVVAGSSGSIFMGFMLAVFGIFAGAKLATALLVMAIPLADAVWVIGERLWKGKSIFQGNDQRHLHYKLIRLGWPSWKVSLILSGVSLCLAVIALTMDSLVKIISFAFVFCCVIAVDALILFKLQKNYE